MARIKNESKALKRMTATANQPPDRWQAPWLPIGGTSITTHLSVVMIAIITILFLVLLVDGAEANEVSDIDPIEIPNVDENRTVFEDAPSNLASLANERNNALASTEPGRGVASNKKKTTKGKGTKGESKDKKSTKPKTKTDKMMEELQTRYGDQLDSLLSATKEYHLEMGMAPSKVTNNYIIEALHEVMSKGKVVKPSMVHWARVIMRKDKLISILDQEHSKYPEIYAYKDGVYSLATNYIDRRVQRLLGNDWTSHKGLEILKYIRIKKAVDRKDIDANPMIINLRNKLLNVDTYEFMEHTPEYLSLIQSPHIYDPEADCPITKRFLSEVLQEKDLDVVQEFFGYCLWKGYPNPAVMLLIGEGRNGKSTFINLIKAFLGEKNISSVDIHKFSEKFMIAELYLKSANLCGDIPPNDITETSIFKLATGRDTITAQYKWGKVFQFDNFAKMIFSANKLPECDDDTDAWWYRWMIVDFINMFVGDDDDPDLLDKMTTIEEQSGQLNYALEGLKRLRSNNWKFSYTESIDEMKARFGQDHSTNKSDPFKDFLNAKCVMSTPKKYVIKEVLWNTYLDYCYQFPDCPPISKKEFYQRLEKIDTITDDRIGCQDGKRHRVWKGIRLTNDDGRGTGIIDQQPIMNEYGFMPDEGSNEVEVPVKTKPKKPKYEWEHDNRYFLIRDRKFIYHRKSWDGKVYEVTPNGAVSGKDEPRGLTKKVIDAMMTTRETGEAVVLSDKCLVIPPEDYTLADKELWEEWREAEKEMYGEVSSPRTLAEIETEELEQAKEG